MPYQSESFKGITTVMCLIIIDLILIMDLIGTVGIIQIMVGTTSIDLTVGILETGITVHLFIITYLLNLK